jgi:cytochrome c oxidase subunit IV
MAEGHSTDTHHGPDLKTYLIIGGALAFFTATSFFSNYAYRAEYISATTSFILILGVAVIKAGLVGWCFMHLMVDWTKTYFMIIPAFILGAMLIFVLLPDIVLAWHNDPVLLDGEPPISTTATR